MTGLRGFCEHCGKERVLTTEECIQDFLIKGELFGVAVTVAICPTCLCIVPHPKLDRYQRRRASDAYRQAHGLLTGAEIVGIRTRYGLSQRAMARLLGWGPITIHRYEQGGIQNRAHDTVLRMVARDPAFLLTRLETCRDDLSALGYVRLRESILRGGRWVHVFEPSVAGQA